MFKMMNLTLQFKTTIENNFLKSQLWLFLFYDCLATKSEGDKMFTKECLRTAFEKLSKVDKWDNYCVKGGRWVKDRPVFDSHEDMINAAVNNEHLFEHINQNVINGLPCFEISTDCDIGRLINSENESAGGQYEIKGFITKENVFELGRALASFTSNYIEILEEYPIYLGESGSVYFCYEWSYKQHMTEIISKTLFVYRTLVIKKIPRSYIDCSVLEGFFAEFKDVWVD